MPKPGPVRIAVDIGGTFTDLALMRAGRLEASAKTLTTPADPSQGVEDGLRRLFDSVPPTAVSDVVHGTTLVSNALIERRGVKTALVTTKGFRDVLAIGREHRYDLYDLFLQSPEPLVPRRLRWEVDERVLADGTVEKEPDPEEVVRLAARARVEGVQAVAVSLLHSYLHPENERAVGQVLRRELPEVAVTLSSEVVPELGEYVRTSTVVANAYVLPLVDAYLRRLEERLRTLGVTAPLHVMLSTGGLAAVETACAYPIRICESGPAAGALSAAFSARQSGLRDILAFDMGGTTAKACLVENGQPLLAREHEVARVHRFARGSGLPLRVPVIDLIEIGAGGGSIAAVGPFGLPKVGPESAEAVPGPVCYGRGGEDPTVTDSDLVLGYLNPNFFLGGEMALDLEAAERALGRLGKRLGLSAIEAAAGVHRVVNEQMASAARIHAVERGRDIRRFALVATGGAGPVHAWGVARSLGIRTLLFPPSAGVASAIGMLTARASFELVRSLPSLISAVDWRHVRGLLAQMAREGTQRLTDSGVEAAAVGVAISVDARHRGQGEAITLQLGAELKRDAAPQVAGAFERAYERLYHRRPGGVELELLTWRVRASGPRPRLLAGRPASTGKSALKGRRRVWSAEMGRFVTAAVYDRYLLRPEEEVRGPAVVEERESTVVIGKGGGGRLDRFGSLRVQIRG